MTSASAAVVVALPTASAPPAAAATTPTAARAASARIRLILMGLLPVDVTRPEVTRSRGRSPVAERAASAAAPHGYEACGATGAKPARNRASFDPALRAAPGRRRCGCRRRGAPARAA